MPLSGKEMRKKFERAGWIFKSQVGSHVKMTRNGEIESIPMHTEISKGLEQKLLKRLGEKK